MLVEFQMNQECNLSHFGLLNQLTDLQAKEVDNMERTVEQNMMYQPNAYVWF